MPWSTKTQVRLWVYGTPSDLGRSTKKGKGLSIGTRFGTRFGDVRTPRKPLYYKAFHAVLSSIVPIVPIVPIYLLNK